jgi:hypothetical protein
MALKDLQKILKQVHSPNEYSMIPHDLEHPKYWIWKVENGKLSDLNLNLMKLRNEHARFDIFINGQYILEKDYIFEQSGKDFHVKLKKDSLSLSDIIKIEGDIDTV